MSEVLQAIREPNEAIKLGLAVDGGGMSGIVSAAALIAIQQADLLPHFNQGIFGLSSGTYNGAYVLSGQPWEGLSIYYNHLAQRGFVSRQRFITGRGPLVDIDLAERITSQDVILDTKRLVRNPVSLTFAYTDLVTCTPVPLVASQIGAENVGRYLALGSRMPILAGKVRELNGKPVADGGIFYQTPIELAVARGCTHILSLASRSKENETQNIQAWQRVLARWLERYQIGAGERYLNTVREAIRYLAQLRKGEARVQRAWVLRVYPDEMAQVGRGTTDLGKLFAGMYAGYRSATEALKLDLEPPVLRISRN